MFETPITVIGRVITDVATRHTTAGEKVVGFRLACQERRFDKHLSTWVDGDRMYLGVSCWRRLGDNVATSLSKGDHVVVSGRLRIQEQISDDGERKTFPEIDARTVGPDLYWHTVMVNRSSWQAPPGQLELVDPPDTQEEAAKAA